jgi:hypothetical protein
MPPYRYGCCYKHPNIAQKTLIYQEFLIVKDQL